MRMEVLGLDPQYSFYTVLAGLSGRSNLDRIPVLAFCSVIPNKILSELCERIMLRGFDSGLTLPTRY